MSQHLESLKIGDSILIRGPSGNIVYEAPGTFAVRKNKTSPPNQVKCTKIGMIAGGTGLTPMYQLIKEVLKNPKDSSKLWLLLANQSEDDILLRNELEALQKENPDRFSLWFTVDRSSPGWKYDVGFVNAEMIQARLPSPASDTVILLCGPPPMINFACNPNLDKLGHQPTNRFAF